VVGNKRVEKNHASLIPKSKLTGFGENKLGRGRSHKGNNKGEEEGLATRVNIVSEGQGEFSRVICRKKRMRGCSRHKGLQEKEYKRLDRFP